MANKHMRYLMMVTMEFMMFEVCANDLMPHYLHPLHFPSTFVIPLTFIIFMARYTIELKVNFKVVKWKMSLKALIIRSVLLRILSRESLQTVLIVKFITFL